MMSPPTAATAAAVRRAPMNLPGATAAGIATAAQLVESTSYFAARMDMTAAPGRLVVLGVGMHEQHEPGRDRSPLLADEYPVLAAIWDNDADDIFGTV
jgi:hypothetical protein